MSKLPGVFFFKKLFYFLELLPFANLGIQKIVVFGQKRHFSPKILFFILLAKMILIDF